MNKRTVETKITWHLEMTNLEDKIFKEVFLRVDSPRQHWTQTAQDFIHKILFTFPKEGDDEKDSDSDDDLDFDGLCDKLDGPADLPVGEACGCSNSCGYGPASTGVPGDKVSEPTAPTATEAWPKANQESNMAGVRPSLDASSTDANLSHAKKLGLFDGRLKDPVAKVESEFPRRQPWTPDD